MRSALLAVLVATGAAASTPPATGLNVVLIPEVRATEASQPLGIRLKRAHVIPQGEEICYTVRVSSATATKVRAPIVVVPVPANTRLVLSSVTGPGAAVQVSMDGGNEYIPLDDLNNAKESDPGVARQVTHIRWQFRHALLPHAELLARFRVVFD